MLDAVSIEPVADVDAEAVRQRVIAVATRIANVSRLALLAAQGPEPERGARYLFDLLRDMSEQLAAPIHP